MERASISSPLDSRAVAVMSTSRIDPSLARRRAGTWSICSLRRRREDVVDRVPVDVELTDVPADVVLRRIAQQLQLGAIGAQNRALGGEQIQPYGGILEKLV